MVRGWSCRQSIVLSLTNDGQRPVLFMTNFPASLLLSNNAVGFRQELQGVSSDLSYLRSFSISYPSLLTVNSSLLLFKGASGTNTYQVRGFTTNSALWAMDISDAVHPKQLVAGVATNVGAGEWALCFTAGSVTGGYYACGSTSAYATVASVERVAWRGLTATNQQADYIIVCSGAVRKALYRLLKYRYRQGLSVCAAPVDSIYNEFGYGVTDPAAIKQFLGYAFHHWRGPAPQYVVLGGTGSYDPRNYYGYNAPELVPVHLGATAYKWTALDGWYVQINGSDAIPDLGLGRMPLENDIYLSNLIDKIVAFEAATNSLARSKTLLAADNYDGLAGYDFKAAMETIRTDCMVANGMRTNTTAYLGDQTVDGEMQAKIRNAINQGVFSGVYIGHGDLNQWSSDNLFGTNDVYTLNNSFFPVMVMLTCENGAFQSPTTLKSMTEAFLERQNRGASGCFASAAETTVEASRKIGQGFYSSLYGDRCRRVGTAVAAGYKELWRNGDTNTPEMSYVEYFGDPAMVVNP